MSFHTSHYFDAAGLNELFGNRFQKWFNELFVNSWRSQFSEEDTTLQPIRRDHRFNSHACMFDCVWQTVSLRICSSPVARCIANSPSHMLSPHLTRRTERAAHTVVMGSDDCSGPPCLTREAPRVTYCDHCRISRMQHTPLSDSCYSAQISFSMDLFHVRHG